MTANLLDFDIAGLERLVAGFGEKRYRAKQLARWVHRFGETEFSRMSDLSKSLQEKLAARFVVRAPRVVSDTLSDDGTRKWLLDVGVGNAVETVFIPDRERGTLCVSTQAGCVLDCAFCSTGKQGFNRDLGVAEIIGQLWLAERALRAAPEPGREPAGDTGASGGRAVSNVVLMGMGEPLLNYANVVPALRLMLDDDAYGLSRRRVTLSTSGIVPMIDALRSDCPVALAVSLHAPDDALRERLMPINRRYPLAELLAACRRYVEQAPREFVTFEYVMLQGINDAPEHAKRLVRLLAEMPCKVNLIPFNPFPRSEFRRPPAEVIRRFNESMNAAGIVTTTRKTRGDDIDAACGQLTGQVRDRTGRTFKLARVAT